MKTNRLFSFAAAMVLLFLSGKASAQVDFNPVINTLRMEARADYEYFHWDNVTNDAYGMHGRYFNLHFGGNLGDKFSYYFRQRIQANPGSVNLFDNTDFLYLNYTPNKNWMFRVGKDALAVGGFEYDAAPIDVLFSTHYWDNFYCFQMAASAAFKSSDGNHMILAQVGNSPYVYTGGAGWDSGLLSCNLFWSGSFGHFKTLYSVNMFQRERTLNEPHFMNYIALGHKLVYDRWDVYLDLMHHSFGTDDWGKNFGVVSCANFAVNDDWNLFIKGAYEQNRSEYEVMALGSSLDCLVPAHHSYCLYGGGFEYKPSFCKAVRVHGYVAARQETDYTAVWAAQQASLPEPEPTVVNGLQVNLGVTWNMDFLKLINK